ncbi:MAG TPA: PilX N-terminal domain-containing pilus assembly protein [Patescibacteria group bacterium]|nr:PilX N-terminal domain-containing pilus assembly protein [Patescibacteria group bacterium]
MKKNKLLNFKIFGQNFRNNSGFALTTVLFIMVIMMAIGTLFISVVSYDLKITKNLKNSNLAFTLAESGIQKALWGLNQPSLNYAGEQNTALGGGKFTVTVAPSASDPNERLITSTGYYPVSSPFPAQRQIQIIASTEASEEEAAFHYAVQIGEWGLEMASNSIINGNVYSNGHIAGASNSHINGDAYAVTTITTPNPEISGTTNPGAPSQQMPVITIDFWKNAASENDDQINGDYTITGTGDFGPRKVVGNLTLGQNSDTTLKGPIYVTGNFVMRSNSTLRLDPQFVSAGTVIVVDGTVVIESNTNIYPTSADPKGYILFASTSTDVFANTINSNGVGGLFYALNGGITINSNGHVVSLIGKKLTLNSSATLDYDMGLASSIFTTGPGGKWLMKSKTWNEIY